MNACFVDPPLQDVKRVLNLLVQKRTVKRQSFILTLGYARGPLGSGFPIGIMHSD